MGLFQSNHRICNRGKMDMDYDEFLQWINKVYRRKAYAIVSV